jgi:hypothetical protein
VARFQANLSLNKSNKGIIMKTNKSELFLEREGKRQKKADEVRGQKNWQNRKKKNRVTVEKTDKEKREEDYKESLKREEKRKKDDRKRTREINENKRKKLGNDKALPSPRPVQGGSCSGK